MTDHQHTPASSATQRDTRSPAAHDGATRRLHQRLSEAYDALWDALVDPREPFCDDDESLWLPCGSAVGPHVTTAVPGLANEAALARLRQECRQLALSNEFAINGLENRVNYLVGSGHIYHCVIKKGRHAPQRLATAAQAVLDRFRRDNRWGQRQAEIVRRCDRDGEAFLRFFPAADGSLRVRFVEPAQVATPPASATDPAASFGVLTDPADVEQVLAYAIDGQWVDATQVQHRKAHVDANVKRGLPLFLPVRKNLRRAEKLLRNMSTVAEMQSAIALIRKHAGATRSAVEQFVADQSDPVRPSAGNPRGTSIRRYGPGTILDVHGNVDYDFPAAQLNASAYVAVLQAELRAVASRLVMPEFMLSSDASNANYASTMVAEGPAVKMFARLQAELVADDLCVMRRALETAVLAGRLDSAALEDVEIQVSAPPLAVRDALEQEQVAQLQHAAGILSPQTWCRQRGLDYDQEQANWQLHRTRDSETRTRDSETRTRDSETRTRDSETRTRDSKARAREVPTPAPARGPLWRDVARACRRPGAKRASACAAPADEKQRCPATGTNDHAQQ